MFSLFCGDNCSYNDQIRNSEQPRFWWVLANGSPFLRGGPLGKKDRWGILKIKA